MIREASFLVLERSGPRSPSSMANFGGGAA
jgi:hypothetical protein